MKEPAQRRSFAPPDGLLTVCAFASLIPCLAAPISNPDLFWHLSAANRIFDLGAIPRVDWLSSTLSGEPWIDFEWLQQPLYALLHASAGMAGLWALKLALMAAAAALAWATLRLYRVPIPFASAALAFWGSASLTRSDLRPEWFSVILFGFLYWRLEAGRLDTEADSFMLPPMWLFLYFALWANLHAAFVYGLALLVLYGALEPRSAPRRRLLIGLAAAVAGSFLQPFGLSLYEVIWRHGAQLGVIERFIDEWMPMSFREVWHWPYALLLLSCLGFALGALWRERRQALAPLLAVAGASIAALRHLRLAAYQVTIGVPLAADWAARCASRPPASVARWICLLFIFACGGFGWTYARQTGTFERVFDDRYAPVLAARFLAQQKAELAPLTLYNDQFGWGGYLGYRLYPDYRIFQDGRYIFHPFLKEEAAAIADSGHWKAFLERYHVDVPIMENIPRWMPTTRILPDGRKVELRRPYYTVYFPKARWALVYWDDKALIFVDRDSADADWLSEHEYKLALPFDDAARDDAISRGEIRRSDVDAEFRRHDGELAELRNVQD